MQSQRQSIVESLTKTAASTSFAFLSNYFLLDRFWTLPPTFWGSVGMVGWFGGGSFIISYVIRRIFNAREK